MGVIEDREYFYTWRTRQETDPLWNWILKEGILLATHFEAHFPDDPDLGQGREAFSRLPGVTEEPWEGMEGAIKIRGEMSPDARSLFLAIAGGGDVRLWDFILFEGERKLLAVDDFSDRFVTGYFARKFMKKLFDHWFEPIPEGPAEGDLQVEAMSHDEARDVLNAVRDVVQTALRDLERDREPAWPEHRADVEGDRINGQRH
ncbi:hypothetical protein [Thermaerobacter sp. PB12/4term]|uniref:hypothetical protein n=1 Tax=Thermaerobacter sp. PB12/4term TaxID=2293838 RepID=UPI00193F7D76|nr:hypothetical protein [Thermaerobacter sp. PB12/4term]